RGQRLIEFMRKRPGQLAELADPRQLCELDPARRDVVLGCPAPTPLDDEGRDRSRLQNDNGGGEQYLQPVLFPDGGRVERERRTWREQVAIKPEALHLAPVNHRP